MPWVWRLLQNATLMAEPHLLLLPGPWPSVEPKRCGMGLASHEHWAPDPLGDTSSLAHPPGPHTLGSSFSLGPVVSPPGRAGPCAPVSQGPESRMSLPGQRPGHVYKNKAFAPRMQSRQRARSASVSKLEFGLGSPM